MGLKTLFQVGPEMSPEVGLEMGPGQGPWHVPNDSKTQHPKGCARQSPGPAWYPALCLLHLHHSQRRDALRMIDMIWCSWQQQSPNNRSQRLHLPRRLCYEFTIQ